MIKVIENMKPWEVMKAHEEGKQWAWRETSGAWNKPANQTTRNLCEYLMEHKSYPVAIIDESQPELTAEWWDGVDWEFFDKYEGLPVLNPEGEKILHSGFNISNPSFGVYILTESPFYTWQGGECPVPANCEVEVLLRNEQKYVDRADRVNWKRGAVHTPGDIIAFRLTGVVHNVS